MNANDMIAGALAGAVEDQPWYKRYSNTVVVALTAIVGLAGVLASAGFGAPMWLTAALGGIVAVGQPLIQRLTKNGMTPRGVDQTLSVIAPAVEEAVASARADNIVDQVTKTAKGALDDILQEAKSLGWDPDNPLLIGMDPRSFIEKFTGK